jgi:glycosyltransferase involved in cell wall biosynthesis
MKPTISVIIPAYNEERLIGECMDSIWDSDFPKGKIEIIVIDDGSTDKTVQIAEEKGARVLKQNHKGAGAARNLGVSKAKGGIIISMDADQLLHKNFLKEIERVFKDKKIGGITPKEIAISKDDFISKSILVSTEWVRVDEKEMVSGDEHLGDVVRALRKNLFIEAKGMDTSLGFYDDAIASRIRDMGYRTINFPEAVLYHYCPLTLKSVASQAVWIGRSYIDYLRSKGGSWMWKNVFVTLYGFSMLLAPLLAFMGWWLPIAYAAPFLLYELKKMWSVYTKRKKTAYVLTIPIMDVIKSFFRTLGMVTKVIGYKKDMGGKLF